MGQFSTSYPGFRLLTDVPGAVVEVVELGNGIQVELNGAGSIAGFLYPQGLDGDCGCEIDDWNDDWESLQDRVKRLTAELKEARKALPDKAASA